MRRLFVEVNLCIYSFRRKKVISADSNDIIPIKQRPQDQVQYENPTFVVQTDVLSTNKRNAELSLAKEHAYKRSARISLTYQCAQNCHTSDAAGTTCGKHLISK